MNHKKKRLGMLEKQIFRSLNSFTEEEKRIITDALKSIMQDYKKVFMDKVAEMAADWISENLPRLLKEIEEEEKVKEIDYLKCCGQYMMNCWDPDTKGTLLLCMECHRKIKEKEEEK